MGWCRAERVDKDGKVTHVEQYGEDPLTDKTDFLIDTGATVNGTREKLPATDLEGE